MRRLAFALCAALWLPQVALAESVYVGDTLRVGVRTEPDGRLPAIAVVTTGDRLEVLERSGSHFKIRTANGVEGWVKSAYVGREKPAALLLQESRAQLAQAREALRRAKAPPGDENDPRVAALEAQVSSLQAANEKLRVGQKSAKGDGWLMRMEKRPVVWDAAYVGGGVVFFLALGFLFGVGWYKHQVSKRLGGFTL